GRYTIVYLCRSLSTPVAMPASLPTGTLTFLFSDIEGSTRLWETQPQAMKPALAEHDALLRAAIESNHGRVVKTTGDGFCAVFDNAEDAVRATLQAQRALMALARAKTFDVTIHARMGLHTGHADLRDGDYYGQTPNQAARIMAAGHGGQVLLS